MQRTSYSLQSSLKVSAASFSSRRRLLVGAAAIAALVAVPTLGCVGLYPGVARTTVHYYDSSGRLMATVIHETSWRQAEVAMPAPLFELSPLEAHSEEYALALTDFYKHSMAGEAATRAAIIEGSDEPAVSVAEAEDPATAAMRARMLWIDHKPLSGEGGMAGAWGALIGLLGGLLVGAL